MKTTFLAMILAAFIGLAACSSSKQTQSGTDTLSGDTSSMDMNTGTGTDTSAAGGMADTSQTNGTTGTTTDTSSMPRP